MLKYVNLVLRFHLLPRYRLIEIIHVRLAGEAIEHGLTKQPLDQMPDVPAAPSLVIRRTERNASDRSGMVRNRFGRRVARR